MNAAVVRVLGSELLTIRIDLDPRQMARTELAPDGNVQNDT
jgi:hypothetical protein